MKIMSKSIMDGTRDEVTRTKSIIRKKELG